MNYPPRYLTHTWEDIIYRMHTGDGKMFSTRLTKEIDATYSHILKIINLLKDDGFITDYKDGRIKYLRLTPKAKLLAEAIDRKYTELEKYNLKHYIGAKNDSR